MKKSLLVVFILLLTAAYSFADTIREIKEPAFSQPAFLTQGGDVSVKLVASGEGKAVKASLSDSLTGAPAGDVVLSAALVKGENSFAFKSPDSAGPGMYDMCIEYEIAGSAAKDCQPHSVVVVKSFDAPFTVVQITDYHVGDPRAEKVFAGVDIKKVRLAAVERANKENPAFILLTGDVNGYAKTYDRDYPVSSEELIKNVKVPIVIIPGNHDLYAESDEDGGNLIDGYTYWPRYFGAFHRVLDYGPFRFICFNSYDWGVVPRNYNKAYHLKKGTAHTYQGVMSKKEYQWLTDALSGAGDRVPVLAAHHNPRSFEMMPMQWCKDCIPPTKFMASLAKAHVPLYIFGHIHRNEEYTDKGVKFVATTSVGSDVDSDELWGIRIFKFKEDKTVESQVIRLFDTPPMK